MKELDTSNQVGELRPGQLGKIFVFDHKVVPIVNADRFATSGDTEEAKLESRFSVFMDCSRAHLGSLVDVQEATATWPSVVVMECRGLLHQQAAPHFEPKAT